MTISVMAMAQAPEKLSYQAVIRDAANALVTGQAVGVQISILEGGMMGTAVYVETHTPTTNANGLATLEIGGGTVVSGVFEDIDWGAGDHFLMVETDPAGGTNYTVVGNSQLLSVPYALHASTVAEAPSSIYHTSPSLNTAPMNATTTYQPIGPSFDFVKESDDTNVEVSFDGRVSGGVFAGANGIRLQLRIDGAEGDYSSLGSITTSNLSAFTSSFAVFEGLSAGSHTVQMYVQTNAGTSTGVLLDPGGWRARIVAKETN
ncbi:MAG: hypothetical protein ACPGD8_06395 [Flavobacteriales bacterium]